MISVVVPAYNASATLRHTIETAFRQTVLPTEVVIVDNASNDSTPEIIEALKQKYPEKIRALRVENNVGPAGARNLGWRHATCEYISFLDADDTWEESKIEKTIEYIRKGYNFLCHWEYLREGSRTLQTLKYGTQKNLHYISMLFGENQMSTSAVTVSRELLEKANGFDERQEFLSAEDLDLWLRLLKLGARVGFIHEPLGSFILSPQSTSASVVRHMEAIRRVIEHHYSQIENPTALDRVKYSTKQARVMWGAGRHLQKQKLLSEAFHYYTRSLKTMPLSWRPYQGLTSCALQAARQSLPFQS
ncbi:MAG: glycosyltransferase family 2 protein [Bdellovibrionales bacterium]